MSKKKFLIVIDMQNDFITGSLANPAAQAIVPKIAKAIESWDGDGIYYTKDSHYEETYLASQEGKNLPVVHCIIGTEGWQLEPSLVEAKVERDVGRLPIISSIIHKSSFGYSWWEQIFEWINEPEEDWEIVLCGTCTGICVISNALILKATYPEALITVDASLCACVTPESHKIALEAMKMCQINVINEEVSL